MTYLISLLNHGALVGAAAALQGLLVNRLGLAVAAIPGFVGLGAYLMVAREVGEAQTAFVLASALLLAILMVWLSSRLRRDLYLLATLAMLECLGAMFGTSTSFGAREGLLVASSFIVPAGFSEDIEVAALAWCLSSLAIVLLWNRVLLSLPVGVAIDRIRETPETAGRWFPASTLQAAVVAQAFVLAMVVGAVYAAYAEHVSPSVFSLDGALLVLAFTVIAGRVPELAAAAAVLYSLLPFALTKWAPLDGRAAAEMVRVLFGALLIAAVLVPVLLKERRRSKLVRTCSTSGT